MSDLLLEATGITKRFGGFTALDDVSIVIRRGERLGLIGPNGSGKSTLVNCISGLLRNEAGRIHFDGKDVTGLPPHRRTRLGIARSFQLPRPFHSLTLLENLAIPLEHASSAWKNPREVVAEATELLEQIGLAGKARHLPGKLTQIELRKLELARALAARPKLVIADEVMAGLSGNEVDEMLTLLFRLNDNGITILMIEHIMRAVMRFSQRLVVFDAGKKIAEGAPADVVRDPQVERAYLGE